MHQGVEATSSAMCGSSTLTPCTGPRSSPAYAPHSPVSCLIEGALGNQAYGPQDPLLLDAVQVEQGGPLQPISRFQAAVVGQRVFIHTHRSLDNVIVLNVASEPPALLTTPVTGTEGAPSSR